MWSIRSRDLIVIVDHHLSERVRGHSASSMNHFKMI